MMVGAVVETEAGLCYLAVDKNTLQILVEQAKFSSEIVERSS